MKVLVCGSRNWGKQKQIRDLLNEINEDQGISIVIEGGARGADTIAANEAVKLGIHVAEVCALWDYYRKAAGIIRNKKMIDLKPDLVIAFHSAIEESSGTANTLLLAENKNIPYILIE